MKTQINPYLTFAGNCSEAMTFYKECLGGELNIQVIKESPMADQWPENMRDLVLHATLIKGNMVLLGSDMLGTGELKEGNGITLSLTCSSEAEMNSFFESLGAGGRVNIPLHDFFGGRLGSLADKYGKSWTLYLDTNAQ